MSYKETLSSSVLFTFTSELEYLIDMLKNGIKPRYSFESLPYEKKQYILPMKCFCDIPLSKTKVHLDWYGNYGLGIRKETLKKIGVTPVMYLHRDTENRLIKNLLQRSETQNFIAFTKKYDGQTYRLLSDNEPKLTKRNFYDEREWRYVPPNTKIEFIEHKIGIKEGILMASNRNKQCPYQSHAIILEYNDIEYIIIKDLSQLPELKKVLKEISKNESDYELILTKVLTVKQIKKDF